MFQIVTSFLFFGCNTNNPHSSSPISSSPIRTESHTPSTLSKETKEVEKGSEKIEEIRIEFDSSILSHSLQDLGLDKEHHAVVESSLNLMDSNCVHEKKIAELMHKSGYGELCVQDRFIVYITTEESKREINQQRLNSLELIDHLVPIIIDKVHHPISSIRVDYIWSNFNAIELYIPRKGHGREKYIEIVKALAKDFDIQIQDLSCDIIDITCNSKIGFWEINGFVFKGLRSRNQMHHIIKLHQKYHTPFKEYDDEYNKSR